MKWVGTIAATAVLICSTGYSAASVASATIQVNNVNDPVNHPYSQTASNYNCAASFCVVTFPATTANETLIQHVSCSYYQPNGVTTTYTELVDPQSGDATFLPVASLASDGYGAYQVINDSTYLFAKTGDQLEAGVNTSGTVQYFYCTISGYHN
jgi:hypothetical protein